jgi:AcrR family transcriptional regulator
MVPRSEEEFEKIRQSSRNKIIKTAIELFATLGYHTTSMDKVAKAAGISKGLIYNYFKSKDELLEAVLMDRMEEYAGNMFGLAQSNSPREILENIITFAILWVRDDPRYWRLFYSMLLHPALPEQIHSKLKETMITYVASLEELLAANGVEQPHLEAILLGATLDAVGLMYVFDQDSYPFEDLTQLLIKKYCGTTSNSKEDNPSLENNPDSPRKGA